MSFDHSHSQPQPQPPQSQHSHHLQNAQHSQTAIAQQQHQYPQQSQYSQQPQYHQHQNLSSSSSSASASHQNITLANFQMNMDNSNSTSYEIERARERHRASGGGGEEELQRETDGGRERERRDGGDSGGVGAGVGIGNGTSLGNGENETYNENDNEDDNDDENDPGGKRRIQRACDLCRRKKIRCDGAVGVGGKRNIKCSNCTEASTNCTYVESAKRRGPPVGYLEVLEFKTQRLESLVQRLAPNLNLTREVGPSISRETFDLTRFKATLQDYGIPFTTQSGRSRAAKVIAAAESPGGMSSPGSTGSSKRRRGGKNVSTPGGHNGINEGEDVKTGIGMGGSGTAADVVSTMREDHERLARLFTSHVLESNGNFAMSSPSIDMNTDLETAAAAAQAQAQDALHPGSGPTVTIGGAQYRQTLSENLPHEAQTHADADEKESTEQRLATEVLTGTTDSAGHPLMSQMNEINLAEGYRFHGKSSGVQLLRTVMDYKFASAEDSVQRQFMVTSAHSSRRPEYWSLPKWEAEVSQGVSEPLDLSQWPDADLCQRLIDIYFETDNLTMPLLNKIIFRRDYDAGRWKSDRLFAKVCLMVFANAARFVDDPRAWWYADDEAKAREAMLSNPEVYRHSAGWKWCEMVINMGKSFLVVAVLEDLQIYVLLSQFLMRSAVMSTVWAISGLGIKVCQDIGLHSKASASRFETRAEAELYKRAFWCCVYIDRLTSAAMGRPVTLQDDDLDAEYPLEVDDEYWETSMQSTDFVQPPGVPSKISLFVSLLKLTRIIANVLRGVYSVHRTNKERDLEDPAVQKRIVAELDSDLYSWLDAMPEHLRWDPQRKDPVQFEQSCVVYGMFYFVQILIHRPFIPTAGNVSKTSSLAFPSLAICTNAARSCSHLVEAQAARGRPNHHMLLPTFTSAIVLLIGVWGGRKGGANRDSSSALSDVRKCLKALKDAERTWRGAGRMRDVLMELASISDTSLGTPSTAVATPEQGKLLSSSAVPTRSHGTAGEQVSIDENGNEGGGGDGSHRPSPIRSTNSTRAVVPSNLCEMTSPQQQQQSQTQSQPWFMQPNGGLSVSSSTATAISNNMSQGGSPWSAPLVSTVASNSFTRSTSAPQDHQQQQQQQSQAVSGVDYPIILPSELPEVTSAALPFINHANMPIPGDLLTDHSGNKNNGNGGIGNILPTSNDAGMNNNNNANSNSDMAPLSIAFTNSGQAYPAVFDTTWPYPNFDPSAWEMNQAMNLIWSMAPGAFEMDQWSNYLDRAQPQPAQQDQQQQQQQQQPQHQAGTSNQQQQQGGGGSRPTPGPGGSMQMRY